jgi:hypothetical protein
MDDKDREIYILRKDNHRLQIILRSIGTTCDGCWANSWQPTEDGEACGQCTLYEAYMLLKKENEVLRDRVDYLQRKYST